MDKSIYLALWGGMYVLCCVLGFLPEQTGFSLYVMAAVSLLFFLPPFLMVRKAKEKKDFKTLKLTRRICLISLGLSTVLLVANMLTVLLNGYGLGNFLYYALVVFSTPMICGQFWAYSLLLWAILMWCCIASLRKLKK